MVSVDGLGKNQPTLDKFKRFKKKTKKKENKIELDRYLAETDKTKDDFDVLFSGK